MSELNEPIYLHDGQVVLHDIRGLKRKEPEQDEVQVIDKDAEFDKAIKLLLHYQHKISDIAAVATRFIAEARNSYNFHLEQNKYFLREYAMEHLKRDKDGEIKGKSYKSIAAGGGVFFRQKAEKITLNLDKLPLIKDFIESYLPDKTEVIAEKITFECDSKELIDVLKQIADVKAQELFAGSEEGSVTSQIEAATEQGLQEIFNEFGIEVEEADPFYDLRIGSNKAFTTASIKSNLTQAIEGTFRANEEEEVDLLIEELQ
jgi:hypothetical protein